MFKKQTEYGFYWDELRVRLLELPKGQWLEVRVPKGVDKKYFAWRIDHQMRYRRADSPFKELKGAKRRQHPWKPYIYLQAVRG